MGACVCVVRDTLSSGKRFKRIVDGRMVKMIVCTFHNPLTRHSEFIDT